EGGPLHLLDRPGHGGALARAGDAEQGLEAVAPVDALGQRGDGLGLIARRLELAHHLERTHGSIVMGGCDIDPGSALPRATTEVAHGTRHPADRVAVRSRLVGRALVAAVVVEHLLFILRPLDVLAPVDPWRIGRLLLHGHLPYAGFPFEYPPFGALAFLLPGLVPRGLAGPVLALQAIALELAVVWFVVRPRGAVALQRWAVLSLLVFPFLSGGFDAFPMAAIAVSTDLLVDGRP